MRNPRRLYAVAILVLLVVLGAWRTARPQGVDPEQELLRAYELVQTDRAQQAVSVLQALSSSYPGTETDARAQIQLAWTFGRGLRDLAATRQTYSQVAARFPNTHFQYTAETQLLDARLLVDGIPFTQYLSELDALVARAGGASISQLRSGRRGTIAPVATLDPATQRFVLSALYMTAAGRCARRPPDEASTQLTQQAINVWAYTRDAFPDLVGSEATRDLQDEVLILSGQLGQAEGFPSDRTPPRIVKVRPEGTTGRNSDIVAKLNDGPISESQVNVASLVLLIDGAQVAPALFTKTSRKIKSGSGKVFQKTKVRFRPPQPLAPGSHQATLKVSDMSGNPVERSWSFTVRDGRKDDRDDETGDDRCDQEPDDKDD